MRIRVLQGTRNEQGQIVTDTWREMPQCISKRGIENTRSWE